jgi:hypothetical protein
MIYLDPQDVPDVFRNVFPSYNGRKWKVQVRESVTMSDTQWAGGSRSEYRAVDLLSGESCAQSEGSKGKWFDPQSPTFTLAENQAIVEHSYYCGKDMGLTIYIHPDNARKLLKAPPKLDDLEGRILTLICSIKGGARKDEWNRVGIGGSYGANHPTIRQLEKRGFLKINKRGAVAVTTAGRNARP